MKPLDLAGTLATLLVIATVSACATTPVSDRRGPTPITEKERRLGAEAAQGIRDSVGLVETGPLPSYVRAVGTRLTRQLPRQDVSYRFHVANMPEPNAFALPGGYIYVTRGLVVLIESEDELASVLAHEVAHVAARHYAKRQAQSAPLLPLRIVANLGGAATAIVSPALGRVVAGLGNLPAALYLASYSREQEREADEIGQRLTAGAGWDPTALASFMDTLSRDQVLHGSDPERRRFLASHPTSRERSAETRARADTLTRANADPIATRRELLSKLNGLLVGRSAADGVFREQRFLHPDLGFTLEFPEGWQTVNTPEVVAAREPEGRALALLELVEGNDALVAAQAFAEGGSVRITFAPQGIQIGRLRGARTAGTVGRAFNRTPIELTWIEGGGHLYRITTMTEAPERDQRALQAVSESFRLLTPRERAGITELRLRIFSVREGEDLAQLIARAGSPWTPKQAAAANALESTGSLELGRRVKLAVPEAYAPSA